MVDVRVDATGDGWTYLPTKIGQRLSRGLWLNNQNGDWGGEHEDTCGTHFVVSFLVTRRTKGSLGISIGDCGGGEVAMDDMARCRVVRRWAWCKGVSLTLCLAMYDGRVLYWNLVVVDRRSGYPVAVSAVLERWSESVSHPTQIGLKY